MTAGDYVHLRQLAAEWETDTRLSIAQWAVRLARALVEALDLLETAEAALAHEVELGAELATMLADNSEVHEAFVEQLFRHVAKQPIRAFGPKHLSDLTQAFEKNGFNIRRLLTEIVTASALPADEANGESKKVADSDRTPALAERP